MATLGPIKVGDIYKNSANVLCVIETVGVSNILFRHVESQRRYTTTVTNVMNNWAKITSPPKEHPMIANLQLGTKVRVRPDLIVDTTNYYMSNSSIRGSVTAKMMIMAGNIATITGRTSTGTKYLIKESEGFWTDEMFSEIISLPDEEQPKSEPSKPEPARRSVKQKCPPDPEITIGSHWERVAFDYTNHPIGEIIVISSVYPNDYIVWDDGATGIEKGFFLKRFKPRPDLDCSPEPTTKPTQKDNFMTKLKNTTLVTVDQNKEALIIASKMEAGRIINKQVLKQLSPHLPFFLQGYTKSPLAPIVAANLVAMVANHTQNQKLSKVSELMLLGAADSGVASFNLDKIVDDILTGIKLPKGVLDDEE